MQTGIKYPNSSNDASYSSINEDSSIVEFCTEQKYMDFNPYDYRLKKIIVIKYPTIKD